MLITAMRKLRVGRRLAVGFGFVLLLMLVLVAVSLQGVTRLHDHNERAARVDGVKEKLAGDALSYAHGSMASLLLATQMAVKGAGNRGANESRLAQLNETLDKLGALMSERKEKELHTAAQAAAAKLAAQSRQALDKSDAGEHDAAMAIAASEVNATLEVLTQNLRALSETYAASLADAAASGDDIFGQVRLTLLVLTLLSVVTAVFFAWRVARMITRPVRRAARVSEGIAAGDLTQLIDTNHHGGELGQLLTSLQNTVMSLRGLIQAVRDRAESVQNGAEEIARGNAELASRTESQATTLEQTSASIEEFASSIKQNAESARQAKSLVIGATEIATEGGRVVAEAVKTMSGVSESSKKIADIVGIIDGIAFQTNILALNAAVEAARAGEQGRGFAVVATEVRSLAQRSAEAAKEIKGLIGQSVRQINAGAKLVHDAGATMTEIVESVRRVTNMVNQITDASREQASGIDQVNTAVTHMDQATQQNAALVEEVSATAEAMTVQARELMQAVSAFNLGEMVLQNRDDAAADIFVAANHSAAREPRDTPSAARLPSPR